MSYTNKKLIVLAQSLEQPRIVKRIIEKSSEYGLIEVYGFKRDIHAVNNFGILKDAVNINLNIVGKMSNSEYLGRIANYFKLLLLIYKNHGLTKKEIYVFGLDLRMISSLIINSRIDYEISDIMWLYKSGLKKNILRSLDTFLAKHSRSVTFTSMGFYEMHYKNFLKPERVCIKENKFKTYGKVSPITNFKKDKIRIAYIGAFRYQTIIEHLVNAVAKNKNIILNFYGDGHKSIVETVMKSALKNKNITFNGAFKNPDDLEKIYAENNLNFVAYNNLLDNEKVAMPNKFYESGYFNIPIVCAENTYVGKRVLNQKMGWTIGVDYESIESFLLKLQLDELIDCHERIKQLDKALFQC